MVEIIALYNVKSILTDFSACRQDKRVFKKEKTIRMKFYSRGGGGMLEARGLSKKSIILENTVLLRKAPQEGDASNLVIQFIWLSFVFCPVHLSYTF